jgi:hypothetical protein
MAQEINKKRQKELEIVFEESNCAVRYFFEFPTDFNLKILSMISLKFDLQKFVEIPITRQNLMCV